MNRRRSTRNMTVMGGEVEPPGTLHVYTDFEGGTFDPTWSFSDASVMTVNWGDNTPKESHATALTHTYAAGSGRKLANFIAPIRTKLTSFIIGDDVWTLAFPDFSGCTALTDLAINNNQFTGSPSFATNTALQYLYLYNNLLSGSLQSLAACTALVSFFGNANMFTGYEVG